MLTIKEAAKLVNLSEHCIRKWVVSGKLVHVKAGRKYLINQSVLLAFIGGKQLTFDDCE
jgi:excisionase family DNA binding protein